MSRLLVAVLAALVRMVRGEYGQRVLVGVGRRLAGAAERLGGKGRKGGGQMRECCSMDRPRLVPSSVPEFHLKN